MYVCPLFCSDDRDSIFLFCVCVNMLASAALFLTLPSFLPFVFLIDEHDSKQAWTTPLARSLHGTGAALQPVTIIGQPSSVVSDTTMIKVSFLSTNAWCGKIWTFVCTDGRCYRVTYPSGEKNEQPCGNFRLEGKKKIRAVWPFRVFHGYMLRRSPRQGLHTKWCG